MSVAWRIEITTEGGFTGRGLGNATVTSDEASGEIARAVDAARPERWRAEYAEPGDPRGYADQVKYRLTLRRGASSHSSSWFDGSARLCPRDLADLFDAAWATRP